MDNEHTNIQSTQTKLSLVQIQQLLESMKKKYEASSNTTSITQKSKIEQITFAADNPIIDQRIHTAFRYKRIITVGDLLNHYLENHKHINVRNIGKMSSSYIISFIQSFEKRQPSNNLDSLFSAKIDLEGDRESLANLLTHLKEYRNNLPTPLSISNQFRDASTENDIEQLRAKLQRLNDESLITQLISQADELLQILNDQKEDLCGLFDNSIYQEDGDYYEH